jgi:predicted ABC-type sugar transport system permease subunit
VGWSAVKAIVYESAGLLLMAASLYFFYRSVDFLTTNDYISAVIAMSIGFVILRGGVDLSRLAILVDADHRTSR